MNSVPAAAVHLSMLAAYLHDRVLTSLAPGFVQAQVSDVSSDLIHGPQSPCYLTTAPTDDSDSDAHPAYHCGQSQPHSSGLDPHGPGTDSGPGSSHRYAAAGEGAGAGADDKGLGALLRCVAKQDELICRCSFTHLRCLLQRGSDLASKLLTQQVRSVCCVVLYICPCHVGLACSSCFSTHLPLCNLLNPIDDYVL